ncbi:thioredoxin [Candidatus Gottesmanbacteria bacterium RIFCSPHIGHO2_02_FULL_39_11]|uniref:Thioredoxin n=1 Tax=Candidatus Gottesmanbacteria bacterium RIFCSPHIGHO2_02_FULL_39_11 TaxID=1798382 RepID=A0A1F5ZL52_9BACT|nr:MAG: thioredoxin [Candidatus Gottesmanbacteria bacterium RIFCSPHIGHO2_02_FULL_39_11]
MDEVMLTEKNFDTEVLKSDVPVLVDFWAVWCGPCKMQNPILEELEKEIKGKAKIGKLNVDDEGSIAGKYGIMSIPTLMIFHNGQPVKQMIGVQSKETLIGELRKYIS